MGVLRQEKRSIRFKFPTPPTQRSNFPLPGHDAQSNARDMPGGRGMLKLRIDRRIKLLCKVNSTTNSRTAMLSYTRLKRVLAFFKVLQGLSFPSLLDFPFTTHVRIVSCQKVASLSHK